MPSRSDEAQTTRARAEANFKKEERAREGAQAMMEYLANNRAVRERTARLRELRLAKEAAGGEQAPAPVQAVATKRAVPSKRAVASKRAAPGKRAAGKQ